MLLLNALLVETLLFATVNSQTPASGRRTWQLNAWDGGKGPGGKLGPGEALLCLHTHPSKSTSCASSLAHHVNRKHSRRAVTHRATAYVDKVVGAYMPSDPAATHHAHKPFRTALLVHSTSLGAVSLHKRSLLILAWALKQQDTAQGLFQSHNSNWAFACKQEKNRRSPARSKYTLESLKGIFKPGHTLAPCKKCIREPACETLPSNATFWCLICYDAENSTTMLSKL